LRRGRRLSSRPSLHGFTLIELLVVISIIALLLALLSPCVSRAKALATTAVCGTHMREVGQGLVAYMEEQGMYVPRDYFTPRRYENYYPNEAHTLVPEVLSQYLGGPDFRLIPEIHECNDLVRDDYLACYFRQMDVLHCPAQPPSPYEAETVTHPVTGQEVIIDEQTYAYVCNSFIFDGHRSHTESAGQTAWRELQGRGDLIYLVDGNEYLPLTNFDIHDVRGNRMPETFEDRMIADDRHGGKAPVMHFDLHVDTSRDLADIDAGDFSPDF
jgi:prepilin-type N-terminal cleavage/methylation domain-containing protein